MTDDGNVLPIASTAASGHMHSDSDASGGEDPLLILSYHTCSPVLSNTSRVILFDPVEMDDSTDFCPSLALIFRTLAHCALVWFAFLFVSFWTEFVSVVFSFSVGISHGYPWRPGVSFGMSLVFFSPAVLLFPRIGIFVRQQRSVLLTLASIVGICTHFVLHCYTPELATGGRGAATIYSVNSIDSVGSCDTVLRAVLLGIGFSVSLVVFSDSWVRSPRSLRVHPQLAFLSGLMLVSVVRYNFYSVNPLWFSRTFAVAALVGTVVAGCFLFAWEHHFSQLVTRESANHASGVKGRDNSRTDRGTVDAETAAHVPQMYFVQFGDTNDTQAAKLGGSVGRYNMASPPGDGMANYYGSFGLGNSMATSNMPWSGTHHLGSHRNTHTHTRHPFDFDMDSDDGSDNNFNRSDGYNRRRYGTDDDEHGPFFNHLSLAPSSSSSSSPSPSSLSVMAEDYDDSRHEFAGFAQSPGLQGSIVTGGVLESAKVGRATATGRTRTSKRCGRNRGRDVVIDGDLYGYGRTADISAASQDSLYHVLPDGNEDDEFNAGDSLNRHEIQAYPGSSPPLASGSLNWKDSNDVLGEFGRLDDRALTADVGGPSVHGPYHGNSPGSFPATITTGAGAGVCSYDARLQYGLMDHFATQRTRAEYEQEDSFCESISSMSAPWRCYHRCRQVTKMCRRATRWLLYAGHSVIGLGSSMFLVHLWFTSYASIPRWAGVQPFPWSILFTLFYCIGFSICTCPLLHNGLTWAISACGALLLTFSAPRTAVFGGCLFSLTMPVLWVATIKAVPSRFTIRTLLLAVFVYMLFMYGTIVVVAHDAIPWSGLLRGRMWILICCALFGLLVGIGRKRLATTFQIVSRFNALSRTEFRRSLPPKTTVVIIFLVCMIVPVPSTLDRAIGLQPSGASTQDSPMLPIVPIGSIGRPLRAFSSKHSLRANGSIPFPTIRRTLITLQLNVQHGFGPHGQLKWTSLVEYLRRVEPDIIALQESQCTLPFLGGRDMAEFLSYHLNMYSFSGPSPREASWGFVILSNFEFDSTAVHVHTLQHEPSAILDVSMSVSNGLAMVPVRLLTTRFSEDAYIRRLQARHLVDLFQCHTSRCDDNGNGEASIVLVDMNCLPYAAAYDVVVDAGFTDAFMVQHSGHEPTLGDSTVDFAFCRDLNVTSSRVDAGEILSPHKPIVTTFFP